MAASQNGACPLRRLQAPGPSWFARLIDQHPMPNPRHILPAEEEWVTEEDQTGVTGVD